MPVKNATDLVILCENRLGYVPDETKELWKARAIQAGRLNKAIAKDPLLTWENLELAVEYLFRKRQPIKSPLYVTYVVKDALKLAAETSKPRPIGELIDEAIALEQAQRPSREQESWLGQLTRAAGSYRQATYDEWYAERGHLLQTVAA